VITLIDYGLGNIQAFANIYTRLGIPVAVAKTVAQLATADKLILPGVGSFDWAMTRLQESGMRECVDDLVLNKKRPVLGVCVGMQMMARSSEEGKLAGLGWIEGEVKRFDERGFAQQTHLPHMGWNDVSPSSEECLFKGMPSARFYFLHSYYFAPAHSDAVLARTDYNGPFASAVRSGNVFGTQFHPEKSHQWGIQLLKNFAEL
jgi:glutamine amidotransferase